jgi:subtilisin-like proprotein convertase family protein
MRLGVRLVILVLVAALGVFGGLGPPLTDAKKPKKAKTVTRTFSDNGQLEIPDFVDKSAVGPANPFPTTIVVKGFKKARIRDVNLTLRTYTHGWPADVDVLLVAPNGRNALIVSDVGSFTAPTPVENLTITLDDEAPASFVFGVSPTSGRFKPTNINDFVGTDDFPAPAPIPSGNVALAVFDGIDPNGTWKLYVRDDGNVAWGSIAGGWELEIKAAIKTKKKKS